jgi:hypothetical protein
MAEEQTKQLISIMNINETIKKAHGMAKEKGFWEDEKRNIPQALLLIISEVSEATEALRKDHYADKGIVEDLMQDIELRQGRTRSFNIMSGHMEEAAFEEEH